MTLPEDWTDDMNVPVREDRTYLELTKAVMDRVKDIDCGREAVSEIGTEFGMSAEDAALAFDRARRNWPCAVGTARQLSKSRQRPAGVLCIP